MDGTAEKTTKKDLLAEEIQIGGKGYEPLAAPPFPLKDKYGAKHRRRICKSAERKHLIIPPGTSMSLHAHAAASKTHSQEKAHMNAVSTLFTGRISPLFCM